MNRHYHSRINYVHSFGRTSLRECPGIIKTMHTGFDAHVLRYANAPVLTRKKLDVTQFSVERFVPVF